MARRRGAGEGSIFKRNDGRWTATLTVPGLGVGTQKKRAFYGRTRREVEEKLARARVAQLDGALVEPSRLKLGPYLTRWLEDVSRPRTGAGTHRNYVCMVDRHIAPHIGGVTLEKLNALHVRTLLAELERQEVGARTRQAVHRMLHRALGDAQRLGLVRVNACDLVDSPRVPRPEPKLFTIDQTRKLLETAAKSDPRIAALATVLLTTGLRISEALGLRWQDVRLREAELEVRFATKEYGGGTPRLEEPKTPRSRRTVPLPTSAVTALRRHRARLGATPHPTAPVFADAAGGFLRKSNVLRRWWHPLLEKAEVPKAGFHTARHAHATALLAAGANPRDVAERLGHSRASLVLDVYGHVLPGHGRELADRMEGLLRGER